MIESIVDARFWIGGILLACQVVLFTAAGVRNRRITRSDQDPVAIRRERLRLVFGVAAVAFFVGGLMGAVTVLTMLEAEGADLLPGILIGTVTGAVLAAWNPWLRRFDVSEDESGLTLGVKTAAIENYPAWLPVAVAIPVAAAIIYSLLVLDWGAPHIVAVVFAAFGTLATKTLFCLSAISAIVLFRHASDQ